ncbi:hypothetical protein FBUS_09544 [Fasciolopsis buskii]|uniref:E3 ubiquitin-protein ligase CBL n=1 Tax=Fasciolopsis buskii TaxID=27845 RepID=A0A8E0RPL0_9TREM|nr:hypothetical protein FBUS_09544 [Fasciolopsis buski]
MKPKAKKSCTLSPKVSTRIEQRYVDIVKGLQREASSSLQRKYILNESKPLNIGQILANLMTLWRIASDKNDSLNRTQSLSAIFMSKFQLNLLQVLENLKRTLKSSDSKDWRTKLTIQIIYMSEELKSIFPNGNPVETYTFMKSEVGSWWERKFGKQLFVTWPGFLQAFANEYDVTGREMVEKLHSTISFTSESYVSVFQLDLFSSLYSVWLQESNCSVCFTLANNAGA